jgi:RNA polymerase-binding transcription factor DksA
MELAGTLISEEQGSWIRAFFKLQSEKEEILSKLSSFNGSNKEFKKGDPALDRDKLLKLSNRLRVIDQSLTNITNGTYGLCNNCHNRIEYERLLLDPSEIICLRCERESNDKSHVA